ncbi:MAG: trehalose-phosphatase, partial [Acidimicrobiales bacterium]
MGTPLRVFSDFDGSLAEITARPQDAVPVAGAVSALEQLSLTCSVAIVSGRRVSFLEQLAFPRSVDLYGLYGIEARIAGVHEMRVEDPSKWSSVVVEAAETLAAAAPAGVLVEVKGLSLTIHFRAAPSAGGWVFDNASLTAARSGLDLRPARMSVELHPPVDIDKGTVVTEVSVGLGTSIYIGDDVG